MHELSIALSILDIVGEEAQRNDAPRVGAVHLKLGALSGVVREALLSAYGMASQTCGFPDSHLIIEEVPVTIFCGTCRGVRRVVSIQDFSCPECGVPSSDILSGRELEVTAMEMIYDSPAASGPGSPAGAEAE